MKSEQMLKLGQIAGALLMAAGVTSCQLHYDPRATSWLFIAGAALYGACRLAAWLDAKH